MGQDKTRSSWRSFVLLTL